MTVPELLSLRIYGWLPAPSYGTLLAEDKQLEPDLTAIEVDDSSSGSMITIDISAIIVSSLKFQGWDRAALSGHWEVQGEASFK